MKVRLADYPQLKLLAWGLHLEELDEALAFELYERGWRHVDQSVLTERERALIRDLTARLGAGVLNV